MLATAIFKPEPSWKMVKIQGFVSLCGDEAYGRYKAATPVLWPGSRGSI